MKTILNNTILLLIFSTALYAREPVYKNSTSNSGNALVTERSGSCAPATSRTYMELNNVRALIEVGGRMWQDRSAGAGGGPAYEVPANSNKFAIFSGALWLGGVDANNQLRVAANFYGQGNDFWSGPLKTDNTATTDAPTCEEWDRFYHITKAEVAEFRSAYEDGRVTSGEYPIPSSIADWPAHGGTGYDYFMAPFHDRRKDGVYDPMDGDYPLYDLNNTYNCYESRDSLVPLFGDETYWWVFNDKGGVHTESGGDAIGVEIRAQAFAFATNDEVNNMTFYNYEIINRSTYTLYNTHFGQWVDADLGGYNDDYVGCDVQRGLGYTYNGDAFDETVNGSGYGANPPAIGVDFFQGPYVDYDGQDNPGPTADNNYNISYQDAVSGDGIVYKGIGIGYGDGIVDNERFGMSSFFYFNNSSDFIIGDPQNGNPIHFYNYLTGQWKNGQNITYGNQGTDLNGIPTNYCFPGSSDPLGWATNGVPQAPWTEQTANNEPEDRRFVQSAGPFTLEPGAKNNLTVGVVYARSAEGDPFASVEALKLADDKAQALFDNCFQVMEGPHAPDVAIQELDQELIISLSNDHPLSNNKNDSYEEEDPFLPLTIPDDSGNNVPLDRTFRFQGYIVYQLKNAEVSIADVYDIDLARPVFQCDIKDGVGQLINYDYDDNLGVSVPQEMVAGSDDGVTHSFKVTEDQFASGDRRLINHLKYHYLAVAYAYNNFKEYDPDDPNALDGQKQPFMMSRKTVTGAIKVHSAIPHIPAPEQNGTVTNCEYGDSPEITRIEGQGNGGLITRFTPESERNIVMNHFVAHPTYQQNAGPVNIKVIDPLSVPSGSFELRFLPDTSTGTYTENSHWELTNLDTDSTIHSTASINAGYDQLIPQWGISVQIDQPEYEPVPFDEYTSYLHSNLEFSDSSNNWLSGLYDSDNNSFMNWIRIGSQNEYPFEDYTNFNVDDNFEKMIGGSWSIYKAVADTIHSPAPGIHYSGTRATQDVSEYHSVDIVITSDRSKWTRCPVIEMHDNPDLTIGQAEKGELRQSASVDMDGNPDNTGTGMGWFPGYAVDLETGERLNMAFGEDSWLGIDNGRDMIWNPTSRIFTDLGEPIFGGKHFIYVFNNRAPTALGRYDGGNNIESLMNTNPNRVWRSCMWVGAPLLTPEKDLLSSDVRITLQLNKKNIEQDIYGENNGLPLYKFNLNGMAVQTGVETMADSALSLINVVPNPYYGYSGYEVNKVDNRVKFTNLPDQCTITIYTSAGTLVRQITKDSPITDIDWDLKNFKGIPIVSGMYIIHVKAPGIGERILKWFGAMRPIDLESF